MSVQTSRSAGASIPPAAVPAAMPRQAWLIVTLLFLFMVSNFADKAVIGIAAVPLMDELHLSPREFGLLGSSFYLLFAVSAVVTGFIVNRVETRWALLVMGLVWALTQFPMLGTVGFATIMAARIALGAGEGPGLSRGATLDLQIVPQRAAHLADRNRRAGSRHRNYGHAAATQLGDRSLFLALGIRRARHRRPCLDRRVAGAGPRRPAD